MNKTPAARSLSPPQRQAYIKSALNRAADLSKKLSRGDAVFSIYAALLKFVVGEVYEGGCHDTSAVLHVLLAESDVASELCIGEVKAGSNFFDHSWVEIDGAIFDVAVCMPHASGRHVGGPVFHSIDLASGETSDLIYGAESGHGLDLPAKSALIQDLEGYTLLQPPLNIWLLAARIARSAGIGSATASQFGAHYGRVRRTFRGATAW